MKIPNKKMGDIIKIGNHRDAPNAEIVHIYTDEEKKSGIFGDIAVVYFQNKLKGIRSDVVWNGEKWKFKNEGPDGAYVNINMYNPILKK